MEEYLGIVSRNMLKVVLVHPFMSVVKKGPLGPFFNNFKKLSSLDYFAVLIGKR